MCVIEILWDLKKKECKEKKQRKAGGYDFDFNDTVAGEKKCNGI